MAILGLRCPTLNGDGMLMGSYVNDENVRYTQNRDIYHQLEHISRNEEIVFTGSAHPKREIVQGGRRRISIGAVAQEHLEPTGADSVNVRSEEQVLADEAVRAERTLPPEMPAMKADSDYLAFCALVRNDIADMCSRDKDYYAQFFKKEDQHISDEIHCCLNQLQQLDLNFLETVWRDKHKLSHYPPQEIKIQCERLSAVADKMKITLERMQQAEPKARLNFAFRWANIIAVILTTVIVVAVSTLPAYGMPLFVVGTLGGVILQHLSREGTLVLNISGIFLNIYQLLTNQKDNDAQETWDNFKAGFSRVSGNINQLKEGVQMLSLIADKMDALNATNAHVSTKLNALAIQQNALAIQQNALVTQQNGIVKNINQVKNTVTVQNAENNKRLERLEVNNKRFEAIEAFLAERFGGQFPVSSLHSPEPSPSHAALTI